MSDHRSLELAGIEVQTGPAAASQVIIADIGDGIYGISVNDLLEVERVPPVAPVPHTSDWLHGVVNLRGSILTLVDPARLLDIGTWQQTDQSRMLVVGRDDPVALAVDRLRGMRQLSDPIAADVFDDLPGNVADYAEGIYRDGEHYITVLNIRRLLDDADQASHRTSEATVLAGGRPQQGDEPGMERGAA